MVLHDGSLAAPLRLIWAGLDLHRPPFAPPPYSVESAALPSAPQASSFTTSKGDGGSSVLYTCPGHVQLCIAYCLFVQGRPVLQQALCCLSKSQSCGEVPCLIWCWTGWNQAEGYYCCQKESDLHKLSQAQSLIGICQVGRSWVSSSLRDHHRHSFCASKMMLVQGQSSCWQQGPWRCCGPSQSLTRSRFWIRPQRAMPPRNLRGTLQHGPPTLQVCTALT